MAPARSFISAVVVLGVSACVSSIEDSKNVVILPDPEKIQGKGCDFLGDVRATGLGFTAGNTNELLNETLEKGGNILVSDYTRGFSKPTGKAFRCSAKVHSELREPVGI